MSVWHGPEDLRGWLVPVSQLQPHAKNPRRGRVELIKASLERFGQVRPILAQPDGTIIAGNHTYLAATALGWPEVAAILNDFTDDAEARAYLVADNRIPELGSYDHDQLLPMLEELEASDGWEGTGYTADDLDDLRAIQGQIATTEQEEFTGGFAASEEELAARAATLQSGRALSELVLVVNAAQAEEFEKNRRILAKHYGASGTTEVVARAVSEAAARE